MNRFDDFDLDLKADKDVVNGTEMGTTFSSWDCIKSIVHCLGELSKKFNCTPGCPVPTKNDKPVASCHKNVIQGNVQMRC